MLKYNGAEKENRNEKNALARFEKMAEFKKHNIYRVVYDIANWQNPAMVGTARNFDSYYYIIAHHNYRISTTRNTVNSLLLVIGYSSPISGHFIYITHFLRYSELTKSGYGRPCKKFWQLLLHYDIPQLRLQYSNYHHWLYHTTVTGIHPLVRGSIDCCLFIFRLQDNLVVLSGSSGYNWYYLCKCGKISKISLLSY